MLRGVIIAALLLGAVAGCTSSGGSPAASTPAPVTSTSSTPSDTPTSPSPSTSSSAPLSPFEDDPAVKGMRKWAEQAARTVNSGHYTDAALRALMTPSFAKGMKQVLGGDVGLRYPGPIPLQPVGVVVTDSTNRIVKICDVYDGYARDPATNKPKAARKVSPALAYLALSHGAWLMNGLTRATGFSCAHVKVVDPPW